MPIDLRRRSTRHHLEPLEGRTFLCALHLHQTTPPLELRPDLVGTVVDGGPEAAADIIWLNRGQASDGFAATFGAGAEAARNVIDAVIVAFERLIGSFNYSDGSSTYNLTVNMDAGNGNGAFAVLGTTLGGKPKSGTISMGRGTNGAGAGWFIDPTPHDSTEFLGPIVNAYSADATPGHPAQSLGDFYTVAAAEITHVLGLYGSSLPLWSSRTTNTGIPDTAEGNGIGTFWVFQGPSIRHLLTSNNAGSQNFGSAIHGAGPGVPVTFGGQTYVGAQDIGNAIYEFGRRYLPSNTFALMFKDAFNYSSVDPAQFGTFYTMRDPDTGIVTVRGGSNTSNDIISISTSGSTFTLSVDIGNDIPGTGALPGAGNLPAFVSTWNISDVSSVVIEAGDGGDTVNVNGVPLSVPLIINADVGPDTINLNSVPLGASVTVNAGASNDTLSLGGGNVNANLLGSISLDAGDGTDTIFFNDAASNGNVSYTIDATSFTIGGSAPVGFNGAEAVRLDANGFNNVIQITQTVFGRPITVNAGTGDDTFTLGTGILSNLPATITLNGQAGFDSITLDDSATTSDPIYFVEGTNITRAGFGPLIHSNSESVRLLADASNGAILVNSTAAGITTRINGGAGNNTISVVETHPSSPVLIEPSVGIDSIAVNQDGFGTATARLDGSIFRFSMLRIGPAGTAILPPGGDRVLVTADLVISTGGRLDLGDNAMIYDYAGFSPVATVKSLLATGYNAGAWNGNGIMGSVAAADASQRTGLGYSEASDLFSSFPAQFAGVAVDNTAVLIRHTFYGDTTLDRQVNLADFNRLASGFGSGSSWSQGNFNYDSSVDLADFNLLAGNFGSTEAAPESLLPTRVAGSSRIQMRIGSAV